MESFEWNQNFLTGINSVDEQHHHLIDVINRLGALIANDEVNRGALEEIFRELVNYTHYHFEEEEELMQKSEIDMRHLQHHEETHESFLDEVKRSLGDIEIDNADSAGKLMEYLSHWLVFHILGEDQSMARQMKRIESGMSAEEAYGAEERADNTSTEMLIHSLNHLFELVNQRNVELRKLTETLEFKVQERTKELVEANTKLEILSTTDEMTGLPNRRFAVRQLSMLWEEGVSTGTTLLCMMIDADHFKEVNDTYGHDAGDRVLIEVARTLKHTVRTDDITCRMGGDEFLIICPDTHLAGGLHIARLVKEAVNTLQVPTGEGYWQGSVSIGVAVQTEEMESLETLIKMADLSVYAAKDAGKNCVRSLQDMQGVVAV